ncbi:hypothetical protein Pcinc_037848 [Petrolisthes cinctipes]|uniref:Uncharacterized protein n=1 Tax=Petrolisthes cinctipes TaxID=88211 RepID=A0AAE1BV71_PETCI|nr:hypothetical protein Pcinc_037848 [Petrolisthes cinctipes]
MAAILDQCLHLDISKFALFIYIKPHSHTAMTPATTTEYVFYSRRGKADFHSRQAATTTTHNYKTTCGVLQQ